MELPSFISQWNLLQRLWSRQPAVPAGRELKAVRLLGARQLSDARRRAEHLLKGARRCACCQSLLDHVFERIGSTLFLDDDPDELIQAFSDKERDSFSARVLAACIVLSGRERVAPAF